MDLKNLGEAAAPETPVKAGKVAKPQPEAKPYEPMVHGESAYDRVTSMLMSVVVGAAIIVGWLWLVYYTNQAYAAPPPSKVEIIEVAGGGYEDGVLGETENNPVPNADVGPAASNNAEPEDASTFNEPNIQESSTAALDPFSASPDSDSEGGEMAAEAPSVGGAVSGGVRRSAVGTGGRPLGFGGGGGGGVAPQDRWSFEFPPGQGEEEYGKFLDALNIELATISGAKTLAYASHVSTTPITRTGLHQLEKRMYMSWSTPTRKQYDVGLMTKAGIRCDANSVILQCLPATLVKQLQQMEFDYKGRQPATIRRTRFKAVSGNGQYGFQVAAQEPLK